jgi:hypothetical protein
MFDPVRDEIYETMVRPMAKKYILSKIVKRTIAQRKLSINIRCVVYYFRLKRRVQKKKRIIEKAK